MTPLTELEKGLAAKVAGASFPPGTASKRFARGLEAGYIQQLSDNGRMFFAFVAHRFRRQYWLSAEEQHWVDTWLARRKALENVRALDRAHQGRTGLAGSPMDGNGLAVCEPVHSQAETDDEQGSLPW